MGNVLNDSLHVAGTLSATAVSLPNASVPATSVVHQFSIDYWQAAGSDVASATVPVHIMRKDGTLVGVEVACSTAPTGGNKQFTVDVKKGNQSSAFATMLSSVVTFDNTEADRQVQAASLASSALTDGDQLQVVVAASGSTGSQGQGLTVTITIREEPGTT